MNRTVKEATIRRFHYETSAELNTHLQSFLAAYNCAKRLKRLKDLTPYEFICAEWRKNPTIFERDPTLDLLPHPPGQYNYQLTASLCGTASKSTSRATAGRPISKPTTTRCSTPNATAAGCSSSALMSGSTASRPCSCTMNQPANWLALHVLAPTVLLLHEVALPPTS